MSRRFSREVVRTSRWLRGSAGEANSSDSFFVTKLGRAVMVAMARDLDIPPLKSELLDDSFKISDSVEGC